MKKVGIIGSSGYTAGELIRCLIQHPKVEIDFLYSHSHSGESASTIHDDLKYLEGLEMSKEINPDVDIVFLCLGHGNSKEFLNQNKFSDHTYIIDLSSDFRLINDSHWNEETFVYGLPELNKNRISKSRRIANPGCFATAIQLALLPLAKVNKLDNDIHITALTGATGAGKKHSHTSHFSWRDNNISVYKPFKHQHLDEIKQSIKQLQVGFKKTLNFVPIRGDFPRGIFASIYFTSKLNEDEVLDNYKSYYQDSPFTHVIDSTIHLKQVVNTNMCFLHVQKTNNLVHVTVALDNLLKGASGQAIENMNLMFGWEQTTGLKFKANYF